MKTDLHSDIKVVRAISPASVTSAQAYNGEAVDTTGYESLEFVIAAGAIGADSAFVPSVEGSDASNFASPTEIAASGLLGTIAGATFDTTDNVVKKLGVNLQTGTRYKHYRLVLTKTGTDASLISAVAVLSNPRFAPVS